LCAIVLAVTWVAPSSDVPSPEGVALAAGTALPGETSSADPEQAPPAAEASPAAEALLAGEAPPADETESPGAPFSDEEWAAALTERPDRTSSRGAVSSSGLPAPTGVTGAPGIERLGAEGILGWQPSWVHEGLPGNRWPMDLVAPALRTVYMTCDIESSTTGWDIGLVKYVDGKQVWVRKYDGPAHGDEWSDSVAARGSAIYTAGARETASGATDLVVSRWDSAGKRIWTRAYDSGDGGLEFASDCVIDGAGNLIVAAASMSRAGWYDWVVIKYKADGTRQWVRRYDGPVHDVDEPYAMVVDSANNVYVVGYRLSSAEEDAVVIKYASDGTRRWVRTYSGPGTDLAFGLRLRPGGGVYAAGASKNLAGTWRGLLLSYKSDGTKVFALADAGLDWPAGSQGVVFDDLEVAPGGTVVCGGAQYVPDVGWQWLLVDVSPTGSVVARDVEPSLGTPGSEVLWMAKDRQGGIYAAGTWTRDDGRVQLRTQRHCVGGVAWTSFWPDGGDVAGANDTDFVQGIAVNGVNVYVLGMRWVQPDIEYPEGHHSQCLMGYVY
jgi:hypothetical protein